MHKQKRWLKDVTTQEKLNGQALDQLGEMGDFPDLTFI
jgi:hypothetical protein